MFNPLHRAAVVAGSGLLAMAVLAGAANFGVLEALVTPDDAIRTATDVLASESTYRLGATALLVVAILDVVVAWALATFLAPVDKDLATLAAWFRSAYAAVFAVAVASLLQALPLFHADRADDGLRAIDSFHTLWQAGLALFGVHLLLVGYLAYRSGFIPRLIGALVALAGAGYVFDGFAELLLTDFSLSVGAFTFVGEPVLMLWLLIKGHTTQAQVTPSPA